MILHDSQRAMFDDLTHYRSLLPNTAPAIRADLSPDLRIYKDSTLEIWYAPLGPSAPVPDLWILGITPGWNQMRIAYRHAAEAIESGLSRDAAAAAPKPTAAFAGSMRTNLVSMMNELGFPSALGVTSASDLFGSSRLRTGSTLRYPVFRGTRNYTGSSPNPIHHSALLGMIRAVLIPELQAIDTCPILPLGKSVELILRHCITAGHLDPGRVLWGFPHPSGANGHRRRQFDRVRDDLKAEVARRYG